MPRRYAPDGALLFQGKRLEEFTEHDSLLFIEETEKRLKETEDLIMNKKQEPVVQVDARGYPLAEPKGNTVAYASVTIGGIFAVNGIRVMNSEKGMFAAMPSVKDNKGEYRDICFPVTKELRAQLNTAVLEAYNAALEKGEPEKASVRGQIKNGVKETKEKSAPAKEKAAKKPDPER